MAQTPNSSSPTNIGAPETSTATKIRNLIVVSVGVILSVLVVIGIQTQTPAASLETLAAEAVPLEQALANGKPSFVEFYANWCTSCQAMAGEMADLRSIYGDQVNFVMLNVDNNKWLPEMLHYRVDGIPHFVYLDQTGETISVAIGEQPKAIIANNLDALTSGQALPDRADVGQTSNLGTSASRNVVPTDRSDNPRSHGAQASQ